MIEETQDYDYVRACITHPNVWRFAGMSSSTDPDLFWVPKDESIRWYKFYNHGVVLLIDKAPRVKEIHLALLPSIRGQAVRLGKIGIAWSFKNLEVDKLTAYIDKENILTNKLAVRVGLEKTGTDNTNNYYETNKEGTCHQQ